MGATLSTSSSSSSTLADRIQSWGESYQPYAQRIAELELDLASIQTEDELTHVLNAKLLVTSRLHKRKFVTEFRKYQAAQNGIEPTKLMRRTSSCTSSTAQESLTSFRASNESLVSFISLASLDQHSKNHHSNSSSHKGNAIWTSKRTSTSSRSQHRRPFPPKCKSMADSVMSRASMLSHHSVLSQRSVSSVSSEHLSEEFQVLLATQQREHTSLQHQVDKLTRDSLQEKRAIERTDSLKSNHGSEEFCTIVLTDVQGSTTLWEAAPELMGEALQLHDGIMRRYREKCLGYEMATEGDAFFLAFSEPQDALSFALTVQHELDQAPWNPAFLELMDRIGIYTNNARRGLRIRMGIAQGKAQTQTNAVTGRVDYYGGTKCLAQSLEAMAAGGQVLTTMDTWQAALHNSEGSMQSLDGDLDDDDDDDDDLLEEPEARRSNGTLRVGQAHVETYGEHALRKSHLRVNAHVVVQEVVEVAPAMLQCMGREALSLPPSVGDTASPPRPAPPSVVDATTAPTPTSPRRPSSGVAPRFPGKKVRHRMLCHGANMLQVCVDHHQDSNSHPRIMMNDHVTA